MKIAIIGVGAMGCLFAAKLSPLADVSMLGTWREQIEILKVNGLSVVQPDGVAFHVPVRVTSDPQEINLVDIALILVKSRQTTRAANQAAQIIGDKGIALTLQNGLGNIETLRRILGEESALLGVTAQGAALIEPGLVHHAGQGPTHLAFTPQTEGLLAKIVNSFRNAGLETHIVNDIDGLMWGKLAINAGINPLTAILRVSNGFLVENPDANAIMRQAAEETAAVALHFGIQLPYESAAIRAHEVAQATAANLSSMLQDVMRGVPTEIAAICGQVVGHGRRVHVDTPVNKELLRLVIALERSAHIDIPAHSPLITVRHLVPEL